MADTTATTLDEAIPTAVASALIEFDENDITRPLVTNVPFPGPGLTHSTPIIAKLTSEADDSLSSQAMDSGSLGYSPSSATVGVHGSYVQLKEIADLGSVSDMMAIAGRLIGQSVVARRETDLTTLFSSLTTNQGGAGTKITPGDFYDAYASLRTNFAPLPYFGVFHPGQIWSTVGIASFFDNSSDAIQSFGVGSVGEDFARAGFSGMVLGFNLYASATIALTSFNGSGAVFSREAFKYVEKRPFRIDIESDAPEVATKIVGTEIWGESMLRDVFGNEMQFDTV